MDRHRTTPPPEGFIFDMDGVLVDTEQLYVAVNQTFFREAGICVPLEEHLTYVGASGYKMWSEIKSKYKLKQEIEWLVENEREGIYRTICSLRELPAVPGIPALVDQLQAIGLRLAVASSSPRRAVDAVVQRLGLAERLSVIIAGDEVVKGKPEPEIFLTCASRMGLAPGAAVVLEDSASGVQAAKAAGMTAIGFANPSAGRQDLSAADLIVDRIDDRIPAFVRTLRHQ